MSQQPLDLRKALQSVRRHRILVGIVAVLGLLAGAGFTMLYPPMLASQALVVLPPANHDTRTQIVIAGSDPVLAGALRSIGTGISLETLRSRIQIQNPAYNVISISGQGKTAAQAEATTNAVARSYVDYLASGRIPGGAVPARVLESATDATGTALPIRLFVTAALGALAGVLIGAIAALAISRSDRRLRDRDEIAGSIGVPVLASISVHRPSDAAGWRKLLENYAPRPVDAWRLRRALQDLDLAESNGSGASLAILSLSSDRKALALGPQLAVFAASLGIRTALVVGPQQDPHPAATLRAACVAPPAPSMHSGNLQVLVSDDGDTTPLPGTALTVVVAVVDGKTPKVADTMHASATVLGVSAGAVTAEQMARVAASSATEGHHIAGILLADPDPADDTTGRLPQLSRAAQPTMWARITGPETETSR